MKTVKRIEPETVLESGTVSWGTVGYKTGKRACYGIFDGDKIVKTNGWFEIYPKRTTAEKQAEWLNRHV